MRTVIATECGPTRCFGCFSSNADSQKKQLFEDADSLWEHICMVHAAWIPFECALCPKVLMPSEAVLKCHYQQSHAGLIPKALYVYDEEKKLLVRRIFLESLNLSSGDSAEEVHSQTVFQQREDSQLPQLGVTYVVGCGPNAEIGQNLDTNAEWRNGVQKSLSLLPPVSDNLKKEDAIVASNNDNTRSGSLNGDLNENANDLYGSQDKVLQAQEEASQSGSEPEHWQQEECFAQEKETEWIEQMDIDKHSSFRSSTPVPGDKMEGEGNFEPQEGRNPRDSDSELDSWEEEEQIALEVEQEEAKLKERLAATKRTTGNNGPSHQKRIETQTDCKEDLSPLPFKEQFNASFVEQTPPLRNRTKVKAAPPSARRTAQPKPARQLRRSCLLCRVAVVCKSEHIWSFHMETKRYCCNDCEFQTVLARQIKWHAEFKHKRTSGVWWTDHMHDQKLMYEKIYERAFEQIPNDTHLSRPISPIKEPVTACRLCYRSVSKRADHIWHWHMAHRYVCILCDKYGSKTKQVIKIHIRNAHKEDLTKRTDESKMYWVDNTKALSKEYDATYTAAYGSNDCKRKCPTGTNSGHSDSELESREEEEEIALEMQQEDAKLKDQMATAKVTICNNGRSQRKRIDTQTDCKAELETEHRKQFNAAFVEQTPLLQNPLKIKASSRSGRPMAQSSSTRQTRRSCLLCGITVQAKSQHIWTFHMETKRYSCNDCNFQTVLARQMKWHAEFNHKRTSGVWWTDHMHDQIHQFEQIYERAFGHIQNGTTCLIRPISPIQEPVTECRLCYRSVSKRNDHIWHWHMADRYVCNLCDEFRSKTKVPMKTHIRKAHKEDQTDENKVYWVDNTEELSEEYATTYTAAYGSNERKRKWATYKPLIRP